MSKEETPITAEEFYRDIYTWGIRKEGQTLSEKECGELTEMAEQYAQAKVLEALESDLKDLSDCYKAHAEDNPKKEVCQVLHTLIMEKQEQIAQTKQK